MPYRPVTDLSMAQHQQAMSARAMSQADFERRYVSPAVAAIAQRDALRNARAQAFTSNDFMQPPNTQADHLRNYQVDMDSDAWERHQTRQMFVRDDVSGMAVSVAAKLREHEHRIDSLVENNTELKHQVTLLMTKVTELTEAVKLYDEINRELSEAVISLKGQQEEPIVEPVQINRGPRDVVREYLMSVDCTLPVETRMQAVRTLT